MYFSNSKVIIAISVLMIIFLIPQSFAQSLENDKLFPDWVRQAVGYWVSGDITDSELLALVENIINKQIIPHEVELDKELKTTQNMLAGPEINPNETFGNIPSWVKDRAEWWIDGKITDEQFLRTIHILREVGYLEYNPEKNIISNEETFQSSLERFLLTEEEILDITRETKWRFVSTEYEFEEKDQVIDSVQILLKDITRVYEPIYYKHKVPSMIMQISEFTSESDLNNYWTLFEGKDRQEIFDSAYMAGLPNENSECFFNYNSDGAVTFCVYGNMIIQVIIYDHYNEHFSYDKDNIILSNVEPTSRFLSEILAKISYYEKTYVNSQLHMVLQKNINDDDLIEPKVNLIPKSTDPEKSILQGVSNFSCVKDDFGLITILGQYNNDNVQRSQVDLIVSFFDYNGNPLGESTATFYNLNEFGTKRFVGHSKWIENFHSCQISVR